MNIRKARSRPISTVVRKRKQADKNNFAVLDLEPTVSQDRAVMKPVPRSGTADRGYRAGRNRLYASRVMSVLIRIRCFTATLLIGARGILPVSPEL
jgi:hypothetical protein